MIFELWLTFSRILSETDSKLSQQQVQATHSLTNFEKKKQIESIKERQAEMILVRSELEKKKQKMFETK